MSTTVEDRLRVALAARAGQVTAGNLQPAAAPSRRAAHERRRPLWAPALAGIAVAAVAVMFVMLLAWRPAHPVLPGNSPVQSSPARPPEPALTPSASPSSSGQPPPSRARPGSTRRPSRSGPTAIAPTLAPAPSVVRTTQAPVPAPTTATLAGADRCDACRRNENAATPDATATG
ncbi:MAG: hypothetical protein QOE51_1632 [Actinoplanes sp.]|jgi:hypothetical protein|nr:hypothetical protein [Actinoplanes sp.]